MQPRALALVVAAIAVLSVFAGLALASPAGSSVAGRVLPAPTAAPHSLVAPQVGLGSVHATNCYGGGYQFDFYVATYDNHVCFYAYDPVDTSAVVTIIDQNATRDGINATAATFAVNTTSGYNYSYQWGLYYSIPLSLVQGGWWNISITGSTAGTTSANFYVHTYGVYLSSDAQLYLPGHTAKVFYQVARTVNDGPVTGLTSLQLVAGYISTTTGHELSIFNGPISLALTTVGNTTITIPTDISDGSAVFVQVWANVTVNGSLSTEMAGQDLIVGGLAPVTLTISGCVYCGSTFPDGSLVQVTALVNIETPYSGSWPAAGLATKFSFFANGAAVANVPGNPPLNGTTNANGIFSIVFIANASAFPDQKPAAVDVNVTDPLYSGTAGSASGTFQVLPHVPTSAAMSVQTSSTQYYSGDTITANWAMGAAPGGSLTGWAAGTWRILGYEYGSTLAQGTLTPAATSGSFTYTVPMDFTGALYIEVIGHNATAETFAETEVVVTAPSILLTPNEATYNPGDTVVLSVATDGSVLNTATLYGVVTAFGSFVGSSTYWSGVVTNHQISIKVPMVSPPDELAFEVVAQGTPGGVLASSWSNVTLAYGIGLAAGIASMSQYTDGSFQPGQTIQVHYQISSINGAPLPKSFLITVYFGPGSSVYYGPISTLGLATVAQLSTTSTSGSLSVTIPSSASSGSQLMEVVATGGACGVIFSPGCSGQAVFGVQVDASPPVLNYELGAGSGLTVGWVVLLILIVVLALLLWRVARRPRSRSVVMAPDSGTTPTASSTDGGASSPGSSYAEGSSGQPASWHEPPAGASGSTAGGSSSGTPPLPQPPEPKN